MLIDEEVVTMGRDRIRNCKTTNYRTHRSFENYVSYIMAWYKPVEEISKHPPPLSVFVFLSYVSIKICRYLDGVG